MRNDSVSVAKGMAIILMVLAHTRFSLYGGQLINMFHMPLFFFFSGYCFKEAHLDNAKDYLKRRIKGIYRPYVLWSLVFLALHNVFFHLNLYNGTQSFQGQVQMLYGPADFRFHALKILTSLGGHDQLLGGYWFLHSLFFGSFIAYGCSWLRHQAGHLAPAAEEQAATGQPRQRQAPASQLGEKLIQAFAALETWMLILLAGCALCLYLNISVPWLDVGSKEFLAAFFIVAGYWYRSKGFQWERRRQVLAGCILLLVAGSRFWQASMLSLQWQQVLPYALSALCGTLLVLALSRRIAAGNQIFKPLLVFAGEHSLQVLTWHFLCFKAVSMLIVNIYHLQAERLGEFPVILEYAQAGWWPAYLLVGAGLPPALSWCRERLQGISAK